MKLSYVIVHIVSFAQKIMPMRIRCNMANPNTLNHVKLAYAEAPKERRKRKEQKNTEGLEVYIVTCHFRRAN
jgi:hypothetical protein